MKTVVIGLSGGVDSAVAAHVLKQQGYKVIGLFMHNWEEEDPNGVCTAANDFEDVKKVCAILDIPYYSVNFAKQYQERVFSYFLDEYKKGRTPNPDVLCNREIKFGPFLRYAKALGADYIATGHYCGISHEDGVHRLLKAKDQNKDQTYFLNQLSQEQLANVLFPLSDMIKPQIREIADQLGLCVAHKKDSTGICFIGERKFREFLQQYLPNQEGDVVTLDGKKVGTHVGLMYYTLGQRRGLGLGGTKDNQSRWFVVDKDLKNNRLLVSHGDESVLLSKSCTVSNVNWIPQKPNTDKFTCFAKFRYRQDEQKVTVEIKGNETIVYFDQRQRAVTPGQFAVFYDETQCLGGGTIETVEK
ncbi:MAG: tRNA 2-thiouridine(34) synthase MnmA [Clostridia bacterium]|nr:tRNA 2-thiouridine(34) synthase MnmA [Clostridia bacterium]